jgi:peptidoglycan/xylan/chitin deacetylase (PgdA/CDA1 family)
MRRLILSLAPLALCSLVGCAGTEASDEHGYAGAAGSGTGGMNEGGSGAAVGGTSAGGTAGTGGNASGGASGTGGSGTVSGAKSDMPAPNTTGVPRPSGSSANLKILPWAGFVGAASYSFDDSQPSHQEHWEALKATGVRMTFYTNGAISWMPSYTQAMKDAVQSGFEVGNHTVNHCTADLSCTTNLGSRAAEIDGVNDFITKTLGAEGVYTMAYPFGDTGYKPEATTRFIVARGTGGGMIGPNDSTDPHVLPIFGAGGGETAATLSSRIDMAKSQGKWVVFMFHSIRPTSQDWYAGVDVSALTGAIDHGKSLGDVWLDSVVNVGAYWVGQKLFAAVTPTTSGSATVWTWTLPEIFPPRRFLRVTVDGGKLTQKGAELAWDEHGYYEVSLDAGELTWTP